MSERITLGCSGKASLVRSDLSRALEKVKGLVHGAHRILLPHGCSNKLTQIWQLKTTQTYYVTVQESKMVLMGLKSRCR